jgi:hypothetical protein
MKRLTLLSATLLASVTFAAMAAPHEYHDYGPENRLYEQHLQEIIDQTPPDQRQPLLQLQAKNRRFEQQQQAALDMNPSSNRQMIALVQSRDLASLFEAQRPEVEFIRRQQEGVRRRQEQAVQQAAQDLAQTQAVAEQTAQLKAAADERARQQALANQENQRRQALVDQENQRVQAEALAQQRVADAANARAQEQQRIATAIRLNKERDLMAAIAALPAEDASRAQLDQFSQSEFMTDPTYAALLKSKARAIEPRQRGRYTNFYQLRGPARSRSPSF